MVRTVNRAGPQRGAFLIAITSEGITKLVETASAFGSAGVFVATLFALFSRFGGPASA
jgi:hypothetical protein